MDELMHFIVVHHGNMSDQLEVEGRHFLVFHNWHVNTHYMIRPLGKDHWLQSRNHQYNRRFNNSAIQEFDDKLRIFVNYIFQSQPFKK